jgi:hypothetical protein
MFLLPFVQAGSRLSVRELADGIIAKNVSDISAATRI